GVRPAINVGISVSRVGGSAQIKAMKSVAGQLKTDLAQYRELESFATFGSDLDKASQATLDRGERLTELLKQPPNSPVPVEEQVLVIYVGTKGNIEEIPVDDVKRFEREFLEYMRTRHGNLVDKIRESGEVPEGDALEKAMKDFYDQFQPSEEPGEEESAEGGDSAEAKSGDEEESEEESQDEGSE
ncbi:MAG TPA: F0F1 ATP synthase subunit alpha, partial [Acidimicrobiales bacterium]|nr:F0F1 ATP synthase subunit alpha [Acidimicrobiales bacterium]